MGRSDSSLLLICRIKTIERSTKMEVTAQENKKESKLKYFIQEKIINNLTLRYVLKRVLSSLITLLLLVAIINIKL